MYEYARLWLKQICSAMLTLPGFINFKSKLQRGCLRFLPATNINMCVGNVSSRFTETHQRALVLGHDYIEQLTKG